MDKKEKRTLQIKTFPDKSWTLTAIKKLWKCRCIYNSRLFPIYQLMMWKDSSSKFPSSAFYRISEREPPARPFLPSCNRRLQKGQQFRGCTATDYSTAGLRGFLGKPYSTNRSRLTLSTSPPQKGVFRLRLIWNGNKRTKETNKKWNVSALYNVSALAASTAALLTLATTITREGTTRRRKLLVVDQVQGVQDQITYSKWFCYRILDM